jgi:xanthine dehydrogenase YagT iron-sulfur-binding subunit
MPDQSLPLAPAPLAHALRLSVSGEAPALSAAAWTTPLDLLREELHLTGTKKGRDHGQCGACTVLVDGQRVNSCLTLGLSRDGSEVTTIKGLAAEGGAPHPLQQAFIDHDAFQCGFCTPGRICSGIAYRRLPITINKVLEKMPA